MESLTSNIYSYYAQNGRHTLPWRTNLNPYAILVSELMLQQTQVNRVIPKFQAFLAEFPTPQSLAQAPLSQVLIAWQGLGYNRRAKFLHQAAQAIVNHHAGQIPTQFDQLTQLPGIGPNTAKAVLVYAFNQPEVFIETNVRSVFLHHFFPNQTAVPDKELLPLVQQHLDINQPRIWYWAVMDYGSFLKSSLPNPSRSSRHYTKQSKFEGSNRQIRGLILRLLSIQSLSQTDLIAQLPCEPTRAQEIIDTLYSEALITYSTDEKVSLAL